MVRGNIYCKVGDVLVMMKRVINEKWKERGGKKKDIIILVF